MATSTLWTFTSWFVEKWNILNYCYGFYSIADLFYQKSHQIHLTYRNLIFKKKWKKKKIIKNSYKWAINLHKFAEFHLFSCPLGWRQPLNLKQNGTFWPLLVTSLLEEFMTIMTQLQTSQVHVWIVSCVHCWRLLKLLRWDTICHFQSVFSIEGKVFNLWVLPIVYIEVS